MRSAIRRLADAVQLRGPLSGDPTARILHALLLGVLAWVLGVHLPIILPFFIVKKSADLIIALALVATVFASLYKLRRGSLRKSRVILVLGSLWIVSSAIIVLNGGIRSPSLVLYVALPTTAAWLLGTRGTLWTAGGCVVSALVLALMDTAGLGPYWYFPGRPFGSFTVMMFAIVTSAVPAACAMKELRGALARSRVVEEARAEELEKAMDVAPVALLVTRDPTCQEIIANRAGNVLFEAEEGANLSLTPKGDKPPDWRFFRDGVAILPQELPIQVAVASGTDVRDWEAEAIMPSGARKFISGGASPLRDAAGRVRGAVGAYQDITASKQRAEAALRESEERFHTKTLFLANVSHELRTPLTAILGFSHLLRRDESVSAKHAEALDMINRSASHLLALIDDILDVARIEAGHDRIEIASVDLFALVRDAITTMRIPCQQKNLELFSVWSGTPIRLVRVDGPKLRQILLNLLANAIKYTDAGSVTVRAATARMDDAGKLRLRIEVEDTGIGISPEEQMHIFDPFVQVGRPNSRKGSGLGLAICQHSAQMMGGTIKVESTPGVGSTFRVELPVEVAMESQIEGALEETGEIVSLAPGQPQFRILVIEDNETNCLLLKRLLQGAGFEVRTAADGETGIGVVSEWRPHFIWLDIRLPGISGADLATQIRESAYGQDLKIAALTASIFHEQRDAVLAAGIDDLLAKPFRPQAVFECMERLLGVRYIRSTPAANPAKSGGAPSLGRVAKLPEDLKAQLLNAVLLLQKEHILTVIHSVSALNPELASELARHADALEFTPIMRAILSEEAD